MAHLMSNVFNTVCKADKPQAMITVHSVADLLISLTQQF